MLRIIRRRLVTAVIVVVVLVVLAGALGVGYLDRIVKGGIEKVGPVITDVPVRVADVHIGLLEGSFTLSDFELGNPPEYSAPNAIYAGHLRVEAELGSLLSEEVVLPLIQVDRPEITLELAGGKTNLGAILGNLKREPEPQEKQSARKLRIGTVRVTNAAVNVAGLPLGQELSLPLPDLELTDVQAGGERKSPRETMAHIASAVLEAVMKVVEEELGIGSIGELQDLLGKEAGAAREQIEQAGKDLEETAGQLKDQLEGLLR